LHCIGSSVLNFGTLLKLADMVLNVFHQFVCVWCVFLELCNFLEHFIRDLQSGLNLMAEVFSVARQFTDLTLLSLDDYTHVVDLSLDILCFGHWLFNCLGKSVPFLGPNLIDKFWTIAVCIDVVFIHHRHWVISVFVTLRKLVSEWDWDKIVETHFTKQWILFDLLDIQAFNFDKLVVWSLLKLISHEFNLANRARTAVTISVDIGLYVCWLHQLQASWKYFRACVPWVHSCCLNVHQAIWVAALVAR